MIENILNVVVWLALVIYAPFVIWKRVRDEYSNEDMVKLFLLLMVFGVVGAKVLGIVWYVIENGLNGWWAWSRMDWWGGVVAGLAAGWWFHLDRARGMTGDVQDAIVEGYWWAYTFVAIRWAVSDLVNQNWVRSLLVLVWGVGLVGFYFVRGRYRRFSWYPSGRVGFMFWMTMIVWGVSYAIGAFGSHGMILFIKLILGLGLLIWGLIGGYRRSGRKAHKDFGWLPGVSF